MRKKIKLMINKELKRWATSERIERTRVRDVLILATGEKKPTGWKTAPPELMEKIGYQEVILEIPTAWLFQKAKTRKKQKNKTLTLGDVLPS